MSLRRGGIIIFCSKFGVESRSERIFLNRLIFRYVIDTNIGCLVFLTHSVARAKCMFLLCCMPYLYCFVSKCSLLFVFLSVWVVYRPVLKFSAAIWNYRLQHNNIKAIVIMCECMYN